jgi:hypothetical protein
MKKVFKISSMSDARRKYTIVLRGRKWSCMEILDSQEKLQTHFTNFGTTEGSMKHRIQTVTQGKWSVSTSTPGMHGEPCMLSVFILRGNGRLDLPLALGGSKFQYGDGNGKIFPNSDAAFAWALEHGYCQRYFRRPR